MVNLTKIKSALKAVDKESKKGSRIAIFKYKSKETGDVSLYTILVGVSFTKTYARDLKILKVLDIPTLIRNQILKKKVGETYIHLSHYEAARREMIESFEKSLRYGVGNNPDNKTKNTYEHFCKGITIRMAEKEESSDILFTGMVINKTLVEKGDKERKVVCSSAKTLAKKALSKMLKSSKIYRFSFTPEALREISIGGKKIFVE